MIHKDLNYLKLSLKGEPFRLIASLQVTNASYNQARHILLQRYENTRAISEAHARAVISYPHIKTEDSSQLRRLQASVQENVLAMQALGVKIERRIAAQAAEGLRRRRRAVQGCARCREAAQAA